VFLINVPVALIGLIAGLALLPESRAAQRPGLDVVGIGASIAGLVALIYGLIEAGQHGWSDSVALLSMAAGLGILAAFFVWERRLSRQLGGQPLVELALFGSRSYTWGVILAAVAMLALIGVLFTLPQYFQGVLGINAMGSGLRLLPLIGGLVVGAVPAAQIVGRVGAKVVVALGFAMLASGLLIGSATSVTSSGTFVAAWMALAGAGMGLATATATSAALSELSEQQSGVGSAVLQALNKTGGPLGTAILGSVLSSTYIAHLALTGVPVAAATAARQSIFGAAAAAAQIHSSALLDSARAAFVNGMDLALIVSGAVALAGVLLAAIFLPRTSAVKAADQSVKPKTPVPAIR
jgi:hypothetical protein